MCKDLLTMPPMPEGLPCPCCCMLRHKQVPLSSKGATSMQHTCLTLQQHSDLPYQGVGALDDW